MELIVTMSTVLGGIAGVGAFLFMYLEYRERDRERRYEATQPVTPALRPSSGATSTPTWWTPTPFDPERFALIWRAIFIYLLGLPAAIVFMFSRRPLVRFHALQSLMLDFVVVATFVGSAVLAAFIDVAAGRTLTDGLAIVVTYGVLAAELGGRSALIIQIARGKPGRMPVAWKFCMRAAAARRLS